jgi:cytochrome c peroxidase
MSRIRLLATVVAACALLLVVVGIATAGDPLTPEQRLGKAIFFDQALSLNANQSCASCHDPAVGWTGPIAGINLHGAVYEGSIPGAFGDRKPPSSAYMTMSPILHLDKSGTWVGGSFWDGRATGWRLGLPAAEQAQGPFLNPKEQALPDASTVVARICASDYDADGEVDFEQVYGAGACASAGAYDLVGYAIAAYEASPEVNAFSSKYDATFGGKAKLTKDERWGLALFKGKAGCAACHPAGKGAVFTDFTFDNLGIPANPENPVYEDNPSFVDEGLGGFLRSAGYDADVVAAEIGKQKVPTLRNVDLRPTPGTVKAYGHNGYFKSLEGIVHFYNTRDVLATCPGPYTEAEALAANCWPAPEVAANVNDDELGDLGLSLEEEAAIVAYLRTLSDGHPR